MRLSSVTSFIIFLFSLTSCVNPSVPKPAGYFRIDLPEKKYVRFEAPCSYSAEYPVYGVINKKPQSAPDTCWLDIEFPSLRAKIHLTYFNVTGNLPDLTESARELVYKHTIKADAIEEKIWHNDTAKVYGILYDIKGNTASAVQFFMTDSIKHYLRGSLYFIAQPNEDSLKPVISFLREDIVHLVETLKWN